MVRIVALLVVFLLSVGGCNRDNANPRPAGDGGKTTGTSTGTGGTNAPVGAGTNAPTGGGTSGSTTGGGNK